MAAEEDLTDLWQSHSQLDVVLELVFLWLGGVDLACCGAACRAWRQAIRRADVWRCLLVQASSADTVHALASVYDGACPWRELYVASIAPWRQVTCLTPDRPARLAAAALNRAGDLLAIAAEDCSFTVWMYENGKWARAGAGSVTLGWTGVERAEWAPDAPLLLLAGSAPLSAQRGALAVLRPQNEDSLESWVVAARATGGGGCWAGEGFLSLELSRLSALEHAPVFGTDVWLNAPTQETEDEFAGTAARVLRIYNEKRAVITQVVCADAPLDARTAQEWAEAEATVRAEDMRVDASADPTSADPAYAPEVVKLEELGPDEAYYRVIYDRGRTSDTPNAWIRVVVLACGGVLGVWPLPRERPPPLHVPDDALRLRMRARAERRQREAEAAAAGEVEEEAPELSTAELRARCDPPTARLRLPGNVLGLTALQNGRAVWASVSGGAICASLPALRVLRIVLAKPGNGSPHYMQPHVTDEYFGSPCGGSSPTAYVWGPAGASTKLSGEAPALAVLLRCRALPEALLLTEDKLQVWQSTAPRARWPDDDNGDNASDYSDNNYDSSSNSNISDSNWRPSDRD
ncbi:uncharacterized protein LOC134663377 [Cydia fagiglandana]|uniref:uncharacterized protein LOC134663377 n=1 Tax=Cydia fagiglandana TaxID=1458189 RepID=UPI002FEE3A96